MDILLFISTDLLLNLNSTLMYYSWIALNVCFALYINPRKCIGGIQIGFLHGSYAILSVDVYMFLFAARQSRRDARRGVFRGGAFPPLPELE